jgi:hypothetical protein
MSPDRPELRMNGAFHAYVRSVFADQSGRARTLHARRATWLRRVAQHAALFAEQRWEGEGGSTRRESALPRPPT